MNVPDHLAYPDPARRGDWGGRWASDVMQHLGYVCKHSTTAAHWRQAPNKAVRVGVAYLASQLMPVYSGFSRLGGGLHYVEPQDMPKVER